MFVILEKSNSKDDFKILETLESVRKFYKRDRIVIFDNCSKDLNYWKMIQSEHCIKYPDDRDKIVLISSFVGNNDLALKKAAELFPREEIFYYIEGGDILPDEILPIGYTRDYIKEKKNENI